MASVDAADDWFTTSPATDHFTSIGVGPGLGQDPEIAKALEKLFEKFRKPMVLDADAINMLGANRALVKGIPGSSILTPHPKEFERLVGSWKDDFERLRMQLDFSRETNTVVLLKGAYTSISTPEGQVYFNNTGNPGMATGGSGDVLTGLVTGLLAQGYTARESAILGAWLHGLAGDRASLQKGQEGLIASDIIEHLPEAFAMSR
jgi:NAD(P)H-hydrate epimerase